MNFSRVVALWLTCFTGFCGTSCLGETVRFFNGCTNVTSQISVPALGVVHLGPLQTVTLECAATGGFSAGAVGGSLSAFTMKTGHRYECVFSEPSGNPTSVDLDSADWVYFVAGFGIVLGAGACFALGGRVLGRGTGLNE